MSWVADLLRIRPPGRPLKVKPPKTKPPKRPKPPTTK